MNEPQRTYVSYLLRLWQVRGAEGMPWRASLENTRTGDRRGFSDLDDLLDYLRQQTEQTSGPNGGRTTT